MSTTPRNLAVRRHWGDDYTGCTMLHIDMDAFYASCEIKRHPELADKPVIIGTGKRSVVSAANYEARKFGVNSAMPTATAERLCPQGVFLPVDMTYYRAMSAKVFATFEEITDRIERVSVDECYMDVSRALLAWKSPVAIAHWLQSEVYKRLELPCSIGIGSNKLIAKIASTHAKPQGILLVPMDKQEEFIQLLSLRALPGVGPSTERLLRPYGIATVRDLAQFDEETLARILKSAVLSHRLYQASRGFGDTHITTNAPEKSISQEHTLLEDTTLYDEITSLLRHCSDTVGSRLRRANLVAQTISIKLRLGDLSYITRSTSLQTPTDSSREIYLKALSLLDKLYPQAHTEHNVSDAIRLVGVGVSHLNPAQSIAVQPSFDDDIFSGDAYDATSSTSSVESTEKHIRPESISKAEKALDSIRERFGKRSVNFGLD